MHFADLYSHPFASALDDAEAALDATLHGLRRLRAAGVTEVALTPTLHLPAPWAGWTLKERLAEARATYERVREACAGRADLPHVHPGARIQALDRQELLRVLEHPGAGLGGDRTLLLDFGVNLWAPPERVIACARAAGHQVVVANPERYPHSSLPEAMDRIRRWRGLGAFLQVELESLTAPLDGPGAEAACVARQMVEEGLAHLLASGSCAGTARGALHNQVLEMLAGRGAEEQAARLMGENPRRLLRGLHALPVRPLRLPRLAA